MLKICSMIIIHVLSIYIFLTFQSIYFVTYTASFPSKKIKCEGVECRLIIHVIIQRQQDGVKHGFSKVSQTGKMSIIPQQPPPPTSSMFTHKKSTMYFNPFTSEWPMQNQIPSTTCDVISFKGEGLHFLLTWGCLHEKTRTGASFTQGWLFDLLSRLHYDWVISYQFLLFEGTFHVDKIHVWFKIANIMHALPVPVYRQTDFTPKRVVVSRLHDTVARFRTGVKFWPRCEDRGELTPGWLVSG